MDTQGPEVDQITINLSELENTDVGDYTVGNWYISNDIEGGQPNGAGEIEESGARDWYTDDRETHHRLVVTLYGPWRPGAREHILRKRREADARAAAAEAARQILLAREEDDILARAEEIKARRADLDVEMRRQEALAQQATEMAQRIDAEEGR